MEENKNLMEKLLLKLRIFRMNADLDKSIQCYLMNLFYYKATVGTLRGPEFQAHLVIVDLTDRP